MIGLLVGMTVALLDDPDTKDMIKGMAQDCKEQEKASDTDVDRIVNKSYPETKEGDIDSYRNH